MKICLVSKQWSFISLGNERINSKYGTQATDTNLFDPHYSIRSGSLTALIRGFSWAVSRNSQCRLLSYPAVQNRLQRASQIIAPRRKTDGLLSSCDGAHSRRPLLESANFGELFLLPHAPNVCCSFTKRRKKGNLRLQSKA